MQARDIEWDRFAYLYAHKGLELHEIVKAAYIFTMAKIIEDEKDQYGYGILNNRGLYRAMIYALIVNYPKDKTVNQSEMARAMGWNRSTISRLVKSMESDGYITYDRDTSTYAVVKELEVPDWIIEFSKALMELQFDDKKVQDFDEEYEKVEFIRGFQVLWDELKNLKPLSRFRPDHLKDDND